jgi:glycine hydroxymethyltransferase
VQPNSGSQANQAAFLALVKPGDTIMGLDLAAGGHLTHGAPPNMSGKWFKAVSYGVRPDDHRIDMDALERSAHEHKPKLIIAGGSGCSRHWDFARFREICDAIGAYFMVDIAHFAGLVAGGAHPSPFPHALLRRPRRTRPCAARAAAWFSPMMRRSPRRSIPRCSRGCKVDP